MKRILGGAAAVAALCLGSSAAYAGTSEALLKRLHDKGILSDEDYAELSKEEAGEQAAPAPAAATAPAANGRVIKATDSGIGFEVGGASIKFSGSINGYYVHDSVQTPGPNASVVGGVAGVGGGGVSAVRNGLLPGIFKVDVTTHEGGWDVGAHFGMYPGINSAAWGALGANSGGQPTALATSGIDFRQTYLTIGRKGFGEVKIGRDIGLFGSDAILNDITLLSAGTPGGNVAPSNTTLGRIGIGYIYTDFQPQITYTTPSFNGLQFAVGVFQPLSSLTGPAQANSEPGFQAKASYDGKFDGVGVHAWVSGITQKHDIVGGGSYTGKGVDFGTKLSIGPVGLLGYYYTASGLGTTVLNLFDTDASGNTRNSHGYYGQATATFGKFTVAGSYGASLLSYASNLDRIANPTLLDKNESEVGQVRYGLTSWVTLISEFTHTTATAHNGNKAKSDALAVGGILFF